MESKKVTDLKKIRKELDAGFGKKTMRNGIEYAWYNASALDAGIQTRANNARKWRMKILELAETGLVTQEKVKLRLRYVKRMSFNATAYYVDNVLTLYVKGGKMLSIDPDNYEILVDTSCI